MPSWLWLRCRRAVRVGCFYAAERASAWAIVAVFACGMMHRDVPADGLWAQAKSSKPCGVLNVLQCRVEKLPTMLDYILGGCEISLFVAIDVRSCGVWGRHWSQLMISFSLAWCCGTPSQFTSSNGDPADPSSLHYVSPLNELNQYERVIRSVGEILMVGGFFPLGCASLSV
jgi:hypothetical protein